MKKRTKLIICLIIFVIILYFLIVGYIAWKDEKNRIIQNNCNFDFEYNVSKAITTIDDNYNSSIKQLNNVSF